MPSATAQTGSRTRPLEEMKAPLLTWYDSHRRDLPFRDLDDPYGVWVSEVMLQQTRVDTAVPYFLRWMERFPTIEVLAEASEEEVLRAWSGLGYYSRARNLHQAARKIRDQHGGRLPADRDVLLTLPGIGPYTAGAIASIAFGRCVAAVDGNVLRVLARLLDDARDIRDAKTRKTFGEQAERLVDRDRPGDWNQAMMELGATVCLPERPACPTCPVQAHCLGHARGRVAELPFAAPKRPPRNEAVHLAWIEEDGHVLLVRADQNLLKGLWGLPGGHRQEPLTDWIGRQTGLVATLGPVLGTASHRFTHRHWQMEVVQATVETSALSEDARWVPLEALPDAAVSTAHRKAIATAQAALGPQAAHRI